MRSTFLFLLITLADDSNAFNLNHRVDSYSNSYSIRGGRGRGDGVLQYQEDSNVFDLQEGEILFSASSTSGKMGSDTTQSCRHLSSSDRRYSASDWLYNLSTWRHSSVLKDIRNPVIALGTWAAVVSLIHKALYLAGRSNWALQMSIPHAAHSFLVSSIGLLLVFRTNRRKEDLGASIIQITQSISIHRNVPT